MSKIIWPPIGYEVRQPDNIVVRGGVRIAFWHSETAVRYAKTDANQQKIVAALRKAGASVQSLATIGKGCPDLLVGCVIDGEPRNIVLEVKDGSKPPSERKLTQDQLRWFAEWKGQAAVVYEPADALAIIGAEKASRRSAPKSPGDKDSGR